MHSKRKRRWLIAWLVYEVLLIVSGVGHDILPPFMKSWGIDILLAAMVFNALSDRISNYLILGGGVVLVAYIFEFMQLLQVESVFFLRGTFDWYDMIAYPAGVALAMTVDQLWIRRGSKKQRRKKAPRK